MTRADLIYVYVWAETFRESMLALDTAATPEQRTEMIEIAARRADEAAEEAVTAWRSDR